MSLLSLAVLAAEPAAGGGASPVLHEPIPPDAREDLALLVKLAGDLPAALETPSGIVAAPDPDRPPAPSDAAYAGRGGDDTFTPDLDTHRPELHGYDDPFTPSTAPFKRLQIFDAVRADYRLYVRDARLVQVLSGDALDEGIESFYANLVVDVAPGRGTRIPSVGPATSIVRARLGAGGGEVGVRVMRDGADNWFLEAPGIREALRGRLVMELAVARAAFGGPLADLAWNDLPFVASLPQNVGRDAAAVRAAIGVSRALRPREAITKLVQYFREFSDSDEAPHGQGNVYLDLALSKKGVCRHRAFAFLVTAQSLGVPTRMVLNEAHAWVEVHDGSLWRRIDLGGAGQMARGGSQESKKADVTTYLPAADPFAWPGHAERGDDLAASVRSRTDAPSSGPAPSTGFSADSMSKGPSAPSDADGRTPSAITLAIANVDAHRGASLNLSGGVRADNDVCAYVSVELWLREAGAQILRRLGEVATGSDGTFSGRLVLPAATPLGDYDVIARTPGDARCGPGETK